MAERPYLSLSAAAKEAGKSKSVLSNAIKQGRLSATRGETGSYRIDPAELFRVYPRTGKNGVQEPVLERNSTPSGTPPRTAEQPDPRREIQELRERLARAETLNDVHAQERDQLRCHIEDLRDRAERAERKEDQLQAVLTDRREKAAERPHRGLWGFLRRGAAPASA